MFEFDTFVKIVLYAIMAFITLMAFGFLAENFKEAVKTTVKTWYKENEKASNFIIRQDLNRVRLSSLLPRLDKADKIYLINPNQFEVTDFQTIRPGTVIEPPNEAQYHEENEIYILEMEDGTYIKAPRREIHLRNWLIWREEINELPDEPVKNTEDK